MTASDAADKAAAVFPSFSRRAIPYGREETATLESGMQAPNGQIRAPMEEFARRVHREGLPLARLWENRSALVSLGLNQKGKPGLWLVQKLH